MIPNSWLRISVGTLIPHRKRPRQLPLLTTRFRSRLRANLSETGLTRATVVKDSSGLSPVQVQLGKPLKETARPAVAA
jgi:hypothetical protein